MRVHPRPFSMSKGPDQEHQRPGIAVQIKVESTNGAAVNRAPGSERLAREFTPDETFVSLADRATRDYPFQRGWTS
jgi:hypothetical protein